MQIVVEITADGQINVISHHCPVEVTLIDRRDCEALPFRWQTIKGQADEQKAESLFAEAGVPVDRDFWATPEEIAVAREAHVVGGVIEIDEDARASRCDNGVYVEAWVFVPDHLVIQSQGE